MGKKIVIADLLNDKDFRSQMADAVESIGLETDAKLVSGIFIKPNLTYTNYKKGVTTRVEFVENLVDVLLQINPRLKIIIGEGEGGYNSFSMSKALKDMGFFKLEGKYSQVKIINLSEISQKIFEFNTPKGAYSVSLPEIFFTEIDISISCPVPKVHAMTRISLSYKNEWGCLPDVMRLKNHYMFDYIISKISKILKFKYAFLDGKYGLTSNGPMAGDPIEVNWFAASNSLGAFDIVLSEMMGFDWHKVGHLRMAEKYGFIPKRENIDIIGDIEFLKRKFVLNRNFWNYPALAAFHSKNLTNLFYFSKLSKLLHDIMYTFRKRPIT